MKITVKIKKEDGEELMLPKHYRHVLQAFIYANIDEELADFLHKSGFAYENRRFKLFTFSSIRGRYEKRDGKVFFKDKVSFVLATPLSEFCKSFANRLLLSNDLMLCNQKIKVVGIDIDDEKAERDQAVVKLLSPVVMYSTLTKEDGTKFTHYYHPMDKEFVKLINDNLKKKYKVIHGMDYEGEKLRIKTRGQMKFHSSMYKGFIVKGYTGELFLKGSSDLIQIALDTGLGGKNSQGFGCLELVY